VKATLARALAALLLAGCALGSGAMTVTRNSKRFKHTDTGSTRVLR
jgi:hypothetical protein